MPFRIGLLFCQLLFFSGFAFCQETTATPEVAPKLKKGNLTDFIADQIEYPEEARHQMVQGRVIVSFLVDTLGKIKEAKIVKSLGYGCDEEALNAVMATSGLWIPGKTSGKKVIAKMTVPVVFALGQKP